MKLPALPIFDFLNRISRRERILVLLVGGAVFFVANLVALHLLSTSFRDLSAQRRLKAFDADTLRLELAEKPRWTERMRWLKERQPPLPNRDVAGVKLEEQIKTAADQSKVILSNQQIMPAMLGGALKTPDYQSVAVQLDGKSDWSAMLTFLRTMQAPENFIAFETASLHTDQADPKVMQGKFKVAKWFTPSGK